MSQILVSYNMAMMVKMLSRLAAHWVLRQKAYAQKMLYKYTAYYILTYLWTLALLERLIL